MLNYMLTWVRTFWGDEEGASALEYGLIIGLIVVGLIVTLGILGDGIAEFFTDIAVNLKLMDAPTP